MLSSSSSLWNCRFSIPKLLRVLIYSSFFDSLYLRMESERRQSADAIREVENAIESSWKTPPPGVSSHMTRKTTVRQTRNERKTKLPVRRYCCMI